MKARDELPGPDEKPGTLEPVPRAGAYEPGDLLANKYRLERPLGAGGQAAVWEAQNLALNSRVALKLLHESAPDEAQAQRLLREARAVASLGHPAVVRVFDLATTARGELFIVMELLDGNSLADELQSRRRLPAREALQLLLPIVDALGTAHAQGIVHRDVKPENIFLSRQGAVTQPKILDFGIVKLKRPVDPGWKTAAGAVLGTPAYLSPEQAECAPDLDGARRCLGGLHAGVRDARRSTARGRAARCPAAGFEPRTYGRRDAEREPSRAAAPERSRGRAPAARAAERRGSPLVFRDGAREAENLARSRPPSRAVRERRFGSVEPLPMIARGARLRTWSGHARRLAAVLLLAASCGVAARARAEPAPAPSTQREHEARARYEEGVVAYRAGRFQRAIALFLAADRLAPSPALAFNVARAYDRLEDAGGALRFYRDYLRREPSPENLEAVRTRIAELESELAERGVQQLTVLSEPAGAFVSVDGEPRGPTPWTGELVPGNHTLTLLKEGYAVEKREVVLDPSHAAELSVTLAPESAGKGPASARPAPEAKRPAPPPRPARDEARARPYGPLPWITLGTGGAALLAAVGFEIARANAEADARAATTQIDYVDRYEAAHSNQTAARVLVGVGGALVLAGGAWVVIDLGTRSRPPAAALARCTSQGCIASLEGAW